MMPRKVETNFRGFNWLDSRLSGTFLTKFPERMLPTRMPTYKTSSVSPILIFFKGNIPSSSIYNILKLIGLLMKINPFN